MQVPMNLTQNIEGGAPALYSGGQVATMKDTVSGATAKLAQAQSKACLLYTSPSPRDS